MTYSTNWEKWMLLFPVQQKHWMVFVCWSVCCSDQSVCLGLRNGWSSISWHDLEPLLQQNKDCRLLVSVSQKKWWNALLAEPWRTAWTLRLGRSWRAQNYKTTFTLQCWTFTSLQLKNKHLCVLISIMQLNDLQSDWCFKLLLKLFWPKWASNTSNICWWVLM